MSSIIEPASHIAWLTARLAVTHKRIVGLLRRLAGAGPVGAQTPPIFAKFLHWLDEVAAAKNEEIGLMTRIENIEREHRFMRRADRLKRAASHRDTAGDYACQPDASKIQFRRIIGLLLIWQYLVRYKINQKKQGLTVD